MNTMRRYMETKKKKVSKGTKIFDRRQFVFSASTLVHRGIHSRLNKKECFVGFTGMVSVGQILLVDATKKMDRN